MRLNRVRQVKRWAWCSAERGPVTSRGHPTIFLTRPPLRQRRAATAIQQCTQLQLWLGPGEGADPDATSLQLLVSIFLREEQRGLELPMELGLEWISSRGEDRLLGENEWLSLSLGRYIPWRNHLPMQKCLRSQRHMLPCIAKKHYPSLRA